MKSSFIPVAKPLITSIDKKNVIDCIDSGWISSTGKYIEKFEKLNADYHNVKHAIAVSNGTVALHIALVALGIGSGDEVIIPNLTFAATANAVLHAGATPVLVDVDYQTWTINASSIKKSINNKTKAIIPVHLYGFPCNMDPIIDLAKKYQLYIIEDCAEAHGAEFNNKKVGSFGDVNCFSFYGNKILTTGEGGICLTNNNNTAENIRELRNHGMGKGKKYWHETVAFNYRMTNIQAAIGCAQIQRIESILSSREEIFNHYYNNLKTFNRFEFQTDLKETKKVCWLFTALINFKNSENTIDLIRKILLEKNIDSRPVFYPLNQMLPYEKYNNDEQTNSKLISQKGISLPTYEGLGQNDIDYICDSLIKITS